MTLSHLLKQEIAKKLNINKDYIFIASWTADALEDDFNSARILIKPITKNAGLITDEIVEIEVYHKSFNDCEEVASKIHHHFCFFWNGLKVKPAENIIGIFEQAELQYLGLTDEYGHHFKFSLKVMYYPESEPEVF
jgi:hypothetical protein